MKSKSCVELDKQKSISVIQQLFNVIFKENEKLYKSSL